MTDEEITRFALQLREAERIRSQIAEDDAAAPTAADVELPPLSSAPSVDRPSIPVAA